VARDIESGSGGRHRACVALRRRSPEVVHLYHVIAADRCHADLFDNSDAWLMVDVAALHKPFPVPQRRPCALHGGFQMRVSGVGTSSSGQLGFRKCGSFVEMRLESDCAGDFGMYFDFRFDVCVPKGLYMYAKQRTLCIANWTSGPYTFLLLRHDVLSYSWIFRFQTSLEESFVAYMLSDLLDDVDDIPTVTSLYFRFDMVRSATVSVSSLCVDESDICATVNDKASPRCKTEIEIESETTTAAPAMTCPRACGLCNATRPTLCKFPSEMVGIWHDGANITDAGFRLTTAANRKSIDVVMVISDAAAVKQRFYCIQWNTSPSSKRTTHGNRFIFDEFLLVTEPTEGCRRRYACAQLLLKSTSVIYFRLSEQQTWPFTSLPSDPVDCSRFDSDSKFRVLVSQDQRDLVTCHLPVVMLTDYRVTLGDSSCDATIAVEPEIRHRMRLTLADCTLPSPDTVSIDCLDSMLAPPTGDVIIVAVIVAATTTVSPTPRTSSLANRVTTPRNGSESFWTAESRRSTTTSTQFTSESMSTSSSSASSFFQPDAVHCWLFARSTFPYEFRIFPGSQCEQVPMTQQVEAGRQATATFVKKRVRSPRLYAADQPVTSSSPELEISPSGQLRDSRRLSAPGRDTEQCRAKHEEAEPNHETYTTGMRNRRLTWLIFVTLTITL